MLVQKFLSMFRPKQKLRKPTTSNIKNNFACEDATLEWHIKAFLNKEITAKKCLQAFIEYMAYDDDRRIKENEIIFDMLEDFLQEATWKTEWTMDCGDYNPARPQRWLDCIHEIYGNKLFYIKNAEQFLTDFNKEITAENIEEATAQWGNPISAEEYLHKEEIAEKADTLREKVESGNYTPKEALLMVKDNWNLLYPYQSTYEAIEYCVAASENHTTPKYFYSAFRDFGHKMGSLYQKAKEK